MRVLVVGGSGMLGHIVAHTFSSHHDVVATVRKAPSAQVVRALDGCRILESVDVLDQPAWWRDFDELRPDVIINCAGVVKQRHATPSENVAVNALFPHELATLAAHVGARLIHISTDCVFSGRRGNYRESDEPDPVDLYGRSKLLGEPTGARCLTLRTSIVGLELAGCTGLIEWFLAESGAIKGYRRAIWSGFTTSELARVLMGLVDEHPTLEGTWHLSSEPISKYHLLSMLSQKLGRATRITPDDSVVIDRSLNSDRFRYESGYSAPSHEQMLSELATAIQARKEHRDA